ncbi:MAG TPA: chaperone NapD [Ramlibacter sp.]|uniref:chaperone NapD n=1 Tax=Ramlibacter sp. TaxID=1917967 RepID=UPI002D810CBD|nr:chaperone NapD [Ramlibacter sp.]HET8746699.1 chaperone NapD [Ramlibacter sp.]
MLVQTRPEAVDSVRARVARLAGATVHAADPAGKLVVTLESEHAREITEGLARVQALPGVICAMLVSEHSEPLAAEEQETAHETSPPEPA